MIKHVNITDKSKCCGCTACYSVCAKDAVQMVPDRWDSCIRKWTKRGVLMLNRLTLLNRFVDMGTTPNMSEIDYEIVNAKLYQQQKLSEEFFMNALK